MTNGCEHDDLLTNITVGEESVRVCSRPECISRAVTHLYEMCRDEIVVVSAAPSAPCD